jgi:hypothetical protein
MDGCSEFNEAKSTRSQKRSGTAKTNPSTVGADDCYCASWVAWK